MPHATRMSGSAQRLRAQTLEAWRRTRESATARGRPYPAPNIIIRYPNRLAAFRRWEVEQYGDTSGLLDQVDRRRHTSWMRMRQAHRRIQSAVSNDVATAAPEVAQGAAAEVAPEAAVAEPHLLPDGTPAPPGYAPPPNPYLNLGPDGDPIPEAVDVPASASSSPEVGRGGGKRRRTTKHRRVKRKTRSTKRHYKKRSSKKRGRKRTVRQRK